MHGMNFSPFEKFVISYNSILMHNDKGVYLFGCPLLINPFEQIENILCSANIIIIITEVQFSSDQILLYKDFRKFKENS